MKQKVIRNIFIAHLVIWLVIVVAFWICWGSTAGPMYMLAFLLDKWKYKGISIIYLYFSTHIMGGLVIEFMAILNAVMALVLVNKSFRYKADGNNKMKNFSYVICTFTNILFYVELALTSVCLWNLLTYEDAIIVSCMILYLIWAVLELVAIVAMIVVSVKRKKNKNTVTEAVMN